MRQSAKMKAATAQQRFSAALLCGIHIVVGLALWIFKPEYISILYTDETGSNLVPQIIISNPFAAILQSFRYYMLDPSWESPKQVYGSAWGLLIPLGITAIIVVVGSLVFAHEAPLVAEEL